MARPSSLGRRLGAELLGTAFLLATVIGSGIMESGSPGVTLPLHCSPTRWPPAPSWWC